MPKAHMANHTAQRVGCLLEYVVKFAFTKENGTPEAPVVPSQVRRKGKRISQAVTLMSAAQSGTLLKMPGAPRRAAASGTHSCLSSLGKSILCNQASPSTSSHS